MQAIIEKMELANFKGCRNATYEFGGKSNSILGQNGAGKSTIATAWYWVFANCDLDLHNNPAIFPLDVEECTPTIRIWMNCDGKSVEVAKIQKRTVKKSKNGGADTVSLSNSYEVNSVEYGERDFKKKMTEYGFDFDLFLPLSHPDVFTSQKSADMRKVLFGMASEKSDKEIADMTDGAEDVAEMLTNYTADEVKAMQNATLRKIREEYGKDGEILRAKIEGMEQSKTDIGVSKLELLKNALNEQIAENKAKQEDISKEFEEQQRASDGILELKFELNDLQRKANEELVKQKKDLQTQIGEIKVHISNIDINIERNNREISRCEKHIEVGEKECQQILEEWNEVNSEEFDEQKSFCPTCGRQLPEDEIESIKQDYEKNKKARLSKINAKGAGIKASIKKEKELIETNKKANEQELSARNGFEKEVADLEKQLSELPESIDISDSPKVQEIQREIAEKEQAMNTGNSAEEIRQQLKAEGEELQKQMDVVNGDIALAQKNIEIDERIAGLRKKQGEYEQNKANAEKILYQLDLVSQKKNTLLQDDVNSHFKLVDFKLFDYLKNGEYKEVCIPTYKGKDMGVSTNTGLEILMKLDVIKGLQHHYNMFLPIFIDGSEALDRNSREKIEMDCQCIFLSVSDQKELQIVTE